MIEKKGLACVDATCPFVKRIHRIVEKESGEGRRIIIIGNSGHPEVEGIMGWSHTPAAVIESAEEAEKFTCLPGEKLCLVSQTTFNYNKFKELVEIFKKKVTILPLLILSVMQRKNDKLRHVKLRTRSMR